MTVIYEITANVHDDIAETYERYMRSSHIPDLMNTGSFTRATFSRSETGRYQISYYASSQLELDQYLDQHAAGLRQDLKTHFPNGVELSREVWKVLEEFDL